jgi:hypothetical protein
MGIGHRTPPTLPALRPAPALTETIKTLTQFGSSPQALDLLALAEWVTEAHTGTELEQPNGTFGFCKTCEQPWPCPSWREVRDLTLQWLVFASNAAIRRSQEYLRRKK